MKKKRRYKDKIRSFKRRFRQCSNLFQQPVWNVIIWLNENLLIHVTHVQWEYSVALFFGQAKHILLSVLIKCSVYCGIWFDFDFTLGIPTLIFSRLIIMDLWHCNSSRNNSRLSLWNCMVKWINSHIPTNCH